MNLLMLAFFFITLSFLAFGMQMVLLSYYFNHCYKVCQKTEEDIAKNHIGVTTTLE